MRAFVATPLRKDGYDVREIPDGGRLLTRIAGTYLTGTADLAYDLVISDIRMPVCNGLQILEGLRKAEWSTPVILMTAFGDASMHSRTEALGAILFDKPFDLDDLRAVVLNLVPLACPSKRERHIEDDENEEHGRESTLTVVASFAAPVEALLAKYRSSQKSGQPVVRRSADEARGGRRLLPVTDEQRRRR